MIGNISNTLIPNSNIKEENIKRLNENSQISKDEQALRKACQDFESVFIHMMLKSARSTVPEGGLVEKSNGTKIFEDMFDQEISKNISTSDDGGIGIANMLYEQMKMGINYSRVEDISE